MNSKDTIKPAAEIRPRPMGRRLRGIIALGILFGFCSLAAAPATERLTSQQLSRITFEQKLNAQLPFELVFRDEAGRQVSLGECFKNRPVILVMGYYECPMLCTIVLNGLVESLGDLKWSMGKDFDVLNVSINPAEKPELAAAKKATYLKRYGRSGAADGWHFLTGDEAAIRKLADCVGFQYAYDPHSGQYAHPSGFVVVTPEGKISQYFFGVTFPPRQVFAGLQAASTKHIGSPIQQLVLLCFHYNPLTGRYSADILRILRVLAVFTILAFTLLVLKLRLAGANPAGRGQSASMTERLSARGAEPK